MIKNLFVSLRALLLFEYLIWYFGFFWLRGYSLLRCLSFGGCFYELLLLLEPCLLRVIDSLGFGCRLPPAFVNRFFVYSCRELLSCVSFQVSLFLGVDDVYGVTHVEFGLGQVQFAFVCCPQCLEEALRGKCYGVAAWLLN